MLKFEFEWEDPGKARGDELRATWSRFAVKVGEAPVTRVTDVTLRSVRDAVYLPLYPLAEWIAQNWFFLQFEARTYADDDSFGRRHSFACADAGYSFPRLSIQPTGESVDLIWLPKYRGHSNIEYIERGTETASISDVVDELRSLLDAVAARLDLAGLQDTPFQKEWRAIGELNADEIEFARMAASSGLDPFDMEESLENTIILLSERLPSETLARFLTATKGKHLSDRANWLESSLSELEGLNDGLSAIPGIIDRSAKLRLREKAQKAPFEWGYDVARKLRSALIDSKRPIPSVEYLANLFGAHEFNQSILIDREPRSQVRVISVGDQLPRFKVSTRRADSDTFALARGVFDEIVAPDLSVNIVADTDLDADKASRAFAAEFLLPSSALRERFIKLGRRIWYEDDVSEMADEFHVSEYVVRHQIDNHQIGELVH
jgi:hypothetical protein